MTIKSKPATREYRDNWDKVFGKSGTQFKFTLKAEKIKLKDPVPEQLKTLMEDLKEDLDKPWKPK